MSTVAFIRRLLDAGFSADDAMRAAEAFEATVSDMLPTEIVASKGAIRTRRWRDRQASQSVTERHETSQNVTASHTPSLSPPPQTPPPHTHPRGDITTRARRTDDFEAFWSAYPAKVGLKAARKAWDQAKDRPDLPAILTAIDRYRRTKPPDRAWCHPSTWLNQGRWADEPLPETSTGTHGNDRPDRHQAARSDARSVWADIIADRDGAGAGPPEPLRLAG